MSFDSQRVTLHVAVPVIVSSRAYANRLATDARRAKTNRNKTGPSHGEPFPEPVIHRAAACHICTARRHRRPYGRCKSSNVTVSRSGSSRMSARRCTVRTTYRRPDQSRRYSSISLIRSQSLSK